VLAASRAAHPSARLVAESVLEAIARGLAMVAVPAGLRSQPAGTAEQLLETAAYDAWIRDLAPGTRSGVMRLDADSAFAVVSGELEVELRSGDTTDLRTVSTGGVVAVPAGWRFRLAAGHGPVTAIHVASPPLASELRSIA
jgi:mannose-6-phosphate isomerase-like protein (cupin superfamily)